MKKLVIIAGLVVASIFGGMTAANAGIEVCYDVNINGNAQAGCETVVLPSAPALP